MDNLDLMKRVLKRCRLAIDGDVFSEETIIEEFASFVSAATNNTKHQTGVILHTGSVAFDAMAIFYAAVSNLVYNGVDGEEVVRGLNCGDVVLYNACRYEFRGISKQKYGKKIVEYAELAKKDSLKSVYRVPNQMWNKISPYFGNATKMGKVGVNDSNAQRRAFYTEVLDYDVSEIPSVTDTSTVLMMQKENADRIVKGLTISFGDKTIRLLDIITASYYTENNILPYGGNAAKSDPILKIANRISVADDLVRDKEGNRNIGFMILGNDALGKCATEWAAFASKKSLQYVFFSTCIDSALGRDLLDISEDINLFACTPRFVSGFSEVPEEDNKIAKNLASRIKTIKNKKIRPETVKGGMSWEEYKKICRTLFAVKDNGFESDAKSSFIMESRSILKLLLTSPIAIGDLELAIQNGNVNVRTPSERCADLKSYYNSLPEDVRKQAQPVLEFVEQKYTASIDGNGKYEVLKDYLSRAEYSKIAVVVPKAYYSDVMRTDALFGELMSSRRVTVSTANRFDSSQKYDLILTLGNVDGSSFDMFRTVSSELIVPILYECEGKVFRYNKRNADELEQRYNNKGKKTESEFKNTMNLYYDDENDHEVEDVLHIDRNIDSFIEKINNALSYKHFASVASGSNSPTTECIATATFTTGEIAYFSKMYCAYVYNENEGNVDEKNVSELAEGDTLIFMDDGDETRDIVDFILKMLVDSWLPEESVLNYKLSKYWNGKLIKYARDNDLKPKDIAGRMKANGVKVQEAAIHRWLDPNSHTVGPREAESIRQIGILVGDRILCDSSERIHEACKEIRKIRVTIRKQIAKSIMDKLSNKEPAPDTVEAEIYARVDAVAIILQIDRINKCALNVPGNLVNRPLQI